MWVDAHSHEKIGPVASCDRKWLCDAHNGMSSSLKRRPFALRLMQESAGGAPGSAAGGMHGNVRGLEAATSVLEEKLAAVSLEANTAHQTRIMLEARSILFACACAQRGPFP